MLVQTGGVRQDKFQNSRNRKYIYIFVVSMRVNNVYCFLSINIMYIVIVIYNKKLGREDAMNISR